MLEASSVRLELIDGVVYDMAGGSLDHGTIAKNLDRAFAYGLDARNCRGFSSDVSVRIDEDGDYVFPDSSYVCGDPEQRGDSLTNPTLIVEVLSPGTERHDRRVKVPLYRAIASVEEILLIASDGPYVECHRRHGDLWAVEQAHGLGNSIHVLGYPVSLADVYRFIEFE